MSFDFTSTANHADGVLPVALAPPFALGGCFKTTTAQGRRFLSVTDSTGANQAALILDITSATGALSGYIATSAGAQEVSSAVIGQGIWQQAMHAAISNFTRYAQLTGNPPSSKTGIYNLSNALNVILSGRPGDHLANIGGPGAHFWFHKGRVLAAIEMDYLANLGNNPRAIEGMFSYWKCNRVVGTQIPDEFGNVALNITGAMNAGSDDPPFATFMTGANIPDQVLTRNATMPAVNLGAPFDNVNSPFTVALRQLGVATLATTTSAASVSASRVIPLSTTAAFSVGDYLSIGATGIPTRVNWLSPSTGFALVAADQTWANGASVYRYPANALTIPGTGIAGNVLSGIPTTQATLSNCLGRAVCNANGALSADTNLFAVTVSGVPFSAGQYHRKPRRHVVKTYLRR